MKKLFSIGLITNKLLLLVKRFPISILLTAGFAFLLFADINSWIKDIPSQLFFFFSLGTLISVTAVLAIENFANCLKQHIITLAVVLLWGVYCFFLPDGENLHTGKVVEIAVVGIVAFLSMFFISFFGKNKDKAFWNFTTQTIFQLGLAFLFGVIIWGGLSLAVLAIEKLFKITVSYNVYGNLAVFSYALFTPLYFLANIPDKIAKHSEEISLNKFLKVLGLYILTPLAAIYALILYGYLFRIIFAWELPDGWVSWLVSALALGGLLIIALLYPARLDGKNRFIVFLSRYFGLIILPLLVLMTIGIFRRIGDYGITIHRCYVLLLNIWFYGIYAYLFITKSQRIKWILISPTVIALFVSVGFWGIPNGTKQILTSEVNKCLDNKKIDIADTTFFDNMEQKNKRKIKGKIEYLYHTYGKESVQPFFSDSIQDKNIYTIFDELNIVEESVDERHFYIYGEWANEIRRVEKFNTFVPVKYNGWTKERKVKYSCKNKHIELRIDTDNRVFSVPLKKIYLQNKENKEEKIIYQGKDYILLIDYFSGEYYKTKDSLSVYEFNGYLFYNK
ncbi:MAG: DUF4153 domain-containing protein [Lentimicrobiaceae bacterium]|nr:DUF4153 domain-containing protein [Lentimicrobiaceae bacterium]